MSNIAMFDGNDDRRLPARFSRQLDSLRANTEIQLCRIEARARVEAHRIAGESFVTKRAMQEVAIISELEGHLGQMCPLAVTRLQALGDAGAMAMVDIVLDTVRKLT